MKFHQLRLGARFRYQDKVLRKVSPLRGAGETDETQRLIPRSAEVTVLDDDGKAVAARLPDKLAGASVQAAIAQFLIACEQAINHAEPALSDVQQAQLLQAVNAAGNDLMARLGVTR